MIKMNIRHGSFLIMKKKEKEKSFFSNIMSFDWIKDYSDMDLLYLEHNKNENAIISFDDNGSVFELNEVVDFESKSIISTDKCLWNNKLLPHTIEITKDNKIITLFCYVYNNNSNNDIFNSNKNFNINNTETSLYNCVYNNTSQNIFGIRKIINSNRYFFSYDMSILSINDIFIILNKILFKKISF